MTADDTPELDLSSVPLFPLPGVVLFPRAVLPLHIFEDRYRAMTADALVGDQLIAMALLKPGWEKSYYGRPEIELVVCVGRILSHEKLADGKYNFLLQGQLRARVLSETGGRPSGDETPYRVARLAPMEEVPALEIDLQDQRQALAHLFGPTALGQSGAGKQFRQIIKTPLATSAVADLAAYTFLECPTTKQSLLAEADVRRRVHRTVGALQLFAAELGPQSPQQSFSIGQPPDPTVN